MMSSFPIYRPRRLRRTETLRSLVRETIVRPQDLVLPLFVVPGSNVRRPVGSMPGVFNTSVDETVRDAREAWELGIPAVLLFGIPPHKDEVASGAFGEEGIVQQAVRAIKRELPELLVITDVCLCEYTSHGHCGIVRDGAVVNDETLELLARQALHHAQAGADIVAPSDMMDGRVGVIRALLDEEGFAETAILAYSAKYASAFYGPFREAADSAPQFGDRRAYQMDHANAEEAIREVALDIEEGADMVMVKPALAYLDIIRRVKDEFGYP
ncbi:MAG TPA: porphobilinogen synthase, partial [Longimicrobiales bacterium]|nr:porphobilinogen synthase [Longimicrobiales bacterium]